MAGKLKTLFEKAAELEGRVSRRVGALGGKAKKEGDDVYSVADKAAPGGRRRARGEKGAAKSGKADEVKGLTSSGRRRIVGGAGVAGGTSLFVNAVKKKDEDKDDSKNPIGPKLGDSFKRPREKAKADSPSKSGGRFGQGDNKTLNGKANVSKEQLEETGLSLTEYMNKWNKTDKRPGGSSSANSSTKSSSESPKKVGIIKKLLFGSDGKMGGKSGIIDNKVTRAFTKRDEENLAAGLVKKQAGGMMKSKGYARGGAVGMSKRTAPGVTGGAPRLGGTKTVPPKTRAQSRATLSPAQRRLLDSVQGREGSKQATSVIQDLSDKYGYAPGKRAGAKGGMGKGKIAKPPGMQMGGAAMKSKMASKGGKMGGKMAPGYKNGGTVGKKSARGVGAAKRGFGRAMR